jgi:hypothetical protein
VGRSAYIWAQILSFDRQAIQRFSATTEESKIWGWLWTSDHASQFWGLVHLFSAVASLAFIIALFLHWNERQQPESRQSFWLRELAALTTLGGGIDLIWGIVRLAIHPPGNLAASMALDLLPGLCWMITTYIIYRSVPAQPAVAAE